MRRTAIAVVGIMLAIPVVLGLGGHVFGYGVSFDKPGVPQGAHLEGPAGKGTITFTVNPSSNPVATIQFDGRCGNSPVNTSPIDVSQVTNVAAFASATDKAIADSLEGFFTDNPAAVAPFQNCYNHAAIGIYVTAVNKSLSKTSSVWVGEATVQGVRF